MYAYIQPKFQLQPIDLVAPGFRGLNLIQSAGALSPAFCTEAQNAVLDAEGRLKARSGFTSLTSAAIAGSPTIRTIHEYIQNDGTVVPIIAWDGGISDDISDPSGNDISGSVVDADGTWQFVNFNGKVIGFQPGRIPIVYTGSGAFAEITEASGTAPDGGIGTAAFGRIWSVDGDLQTIQYSALLDETNWTTGGGVIDMRNVWPRGTDVVTAIEAFNGYLVVFGKRSIVVWDATDKGALGLDPTTLFVLDTISGIGCLSHFSVQLVGETDLLFLSSEGVQSLQRVLVQKSLPVANLSKYVRDEFLAHVQAQSMTLVRSTYNPLTGFYALSFPSVNVTWIFDQRRRWQDEEGDEVAIVTRWSVAPTALCSRLSNQLLASLPSTGEVFLYGGTDDNGSAFRFIYRSPWLDLGEELANRLKILKRLGAILYVTDDTAVVFKWSADFREDVFTTSKTAEGTDSAGAEWGLAEFGLAEFGGGLALRILKVPARGTAQYFRLGIEAEISGEFSLQQAELFTKIGRLA